ncbi:MAG: hypothetical protein GX657_04925 [Chloroflexi bacterium]|nr:hypothetical protein [Chloroflexota bacterium]
MSDLHAEERIEELAVMLGGRATEATRRSAQELLGRNNPNTPSQESS